MKTIASIGALTLAAGLIAGSALAAPPPPNLGREAGPAALKIDVHARGDHARSHHARDRRGPARADRAQGVEGRIEALKTRLKITEEQTPQWDAVAGVMREQAKAFAAARAEYWQRRASGEAEQAVTAPEQMARRDQALATRLEGRKKFTDAFTQLYASLSPEQQKIADDMLTRRHQRR